MASLAVINAVEARLAALWTPLALCPVIGVNLQAQAPADGSPFLQVQYPIANGEQISIGAPGTNVFRETGAIRFVFATQRLAGLQTGLGWCDTLSAIFRGKKFNANGSANVNTWAPSSPIVDNNNDDGNYWLLSFVVPYYIDVTG